jgi:hypothetical protein
MAPLDWADASWGLSSFGSLQRPNAKSVGRQMMPCTHPHGGTRSSLIGQRSPCAETTLAGGHVPVGASALIVVGIETWLNNESEEINENISFRTRICAQLHNCSTLPSP